MFCYQCEQTAACRGCSGMAGACGKKEDVALMQDQLTGALIGLAHAVVGNEELVNANTHRLVREGLFTTLTNVNFNEMPLRHLMARIAAEKSPTGTAMQQL